jgi:hypothetical protein
MNKPTGGAAFPLKQPMSNDFQGMTLLDYFAAHASEEDVCVALDRVGKVDVIEELGDGTKVMKRGYPHNARQIARYIHAYAMLEARGER